ncbi:hypothetical protein ACFXJ5_09220 [Streptomyces sp. NPDC059373]
MIGVDWQQAMERADQIAARGHHPATSWDGRGIRGVLAVALAGVARRQDQPVAEVETGSVLWRLNQGPAMAYELASDEGTQLLEAASEWVWLIRRWPSEPALAKSGGMPRGCRARFLRARRRRGHELCG